MVEGAFSAEILRCGRHPFIIREVRALLRYLLISGVVVGVACGLFVVRIGDRSLFGHLRSMTGGEVGTVIERIKADLDDRLEDLREANSARPQPKKPAAKAALAKADKAEKKKSAKPAAPSPSKPALSDDEKKANERQVAMLREAADAARKMKPVGSKKTRVDEQMSSKQLDALID